MGAEAQPMTKRLHITRMGKGGGAILCKRIFLGEDGKTVSDGTPCAMTRGTATRVVLDAAAPSQALAELIVDLDRSEAPVLGDHVAEADEIGIIKARSAEPRAGNTVVRWRRSATGRANRRLCCSTSIRRACRLLSRSFWTAWASKALSRCS